MARQTVAPTAPRLTTRLPNLKIRDRLSLRAQLIVITALLSSLVAIGLVVVVQLALAGAANSTAKRVLDDRATALIAGIDDASHDGALDVPREQLDPGVAVYDANGDQVAGSVPPSMAELFGDLSKATTAKVLEGGEHFAVMAKPFSTSSGTRGVAVMTERMAPYERSEQAALIVSIVAGALLVAMASGSAAWISRRVLSPVEDMARTADEWSEHDLERRFALGPPTNEITALGNTLDGLLDKVAGVIKAEQRLTSELAHELRTPLTTIHATADLMSMRSDLDGQAQEDLAIIKKTSVSMSETITLLLEIARREGAATHFHRTSLGDVATELKALPLPAEGLTIDLPAGLVVRVPTALVVRALAPVVTNALGVADRVEVSARVRGRSIDILVADAGPGIPDEWVEDLFAPGWSGAGGSGLGLALARRVARSGGGDVTLVEQHNRFGGATFMITFPGSATASGR
jgi:two-component system, OmpR family, sensor kinase